MDADHARILEQSGLRPMTAEESRAYAQEQEQRLRAIPGYDEAMHAAEAQRKRKTEILQGGRREPQTP